MGVAGEAARRHDGRRGRGVHAGGGRHVGDPARPSAGAALPRRPVRLAAPGHLGRLRRLARHRGARRRSGLATDRRPDGDRRPVDRRASGSAHAARQPRRTSCGTASSPGTTPGPRRSLAERIFANSGVRTRQGVVNPLLEDVSDWPTERRMQRYLVEALPLGKEAVGRALTGPASPPATSACSWSAPAPGTSPRAWTSCSPATWACRRTPSGSSSVTWVATRRCPGWARSADYVAARGRPALLLCAELTSLHVQPAEPVRTPSRSSRTRSSRTPRPPSWSCPGGTGVRRARGRRRHRHLHGRPHDLGRHRPRLPDGPVAEGAGGARAARPAAGRRPAGPARPARAPTWTAGRCTPAARASSTWCEEQLGLTADAAGGVPGDAGRARQLLVADRAADPGSAPAPAGPAASGSSMLAFGPGLTLYATLLERTA